MRARCYFGVLAVMLLAAGGCRREPIQVPPLAADEVPEPTVTERAQRPAAGPAVPPVPVDARVAAAADPSPAAALPIVGPGGGIVVGRDGKVMERTIENPREPGIEPEAAPPGVFPPGGP